MGLAAAASRRVFRIVALDWGFATEALSRRKGRAGKGCNCGNFRSAFRKRGQAARREVAAASSSSLFQAPKVAATLTRDLAASAHSSSQSQPLSPAPPAAPPGP
ncbi:hypothetical protein QYE76_024534 [Lolium multiflorum]|uniref:Uncharacterized protein n=1 Tax=Lolium multiflorum TaxID=4521 RepID=A0AAD8RF11_LOLMU|nr:hypothetical protein QYE76_024534 [Lolium multiflorum]